MIGVDTEMVLAQADKYGGGRTSVDLCFMRINGNR